MELTHTNMLINKIKIIFSCFFCLLICSCNKSEVHLYNPNGLPEHLQQIVYCFISEYNIPKGRNIHISESKYRTNTRPFFSTMNIDKHIHVIMRDYHKDIPTISDHRVLYSTKLDGYTLFYEMDKNSEMSISNNLVWKIVNKTKNDEKFEQLPMIVDYTETQFVYNKEENIIELSDFRSETCKGRLNDEYKW
jgi:hypothetical protein